jgi:hypothetical protein
LFKFFILNFVFVFINFLWKLFNSKIYKKQSIWLKSNS